MFSIFYRTGCDRLECSIDSVLDLAEECNDLIQGCSRFVDDSATHSITTLYCGLSQIAKTVTCLHCYPREGAEKHRVLAKLTNEAVECFLELFFLTKRGNQLYQVLTEMLLSELYDFRYTGAVVMLDYISEAAQLNFEVTTIARETCQVLNQSH